MCIYTHIHVQGVVASDSVSSALRQSMTAAAMEGPAGAGGGAQAVVCESAEGEGSPWRTVIDDLLLEDAEPPERSATAIGVAYVYRIYSYAYISVYMFMCVYIYCYVYTHTHTHTHIDAHTW